MTKYEWEKELKRNLSRLPAGEAERILEYYGELFEDKAEQGYSEAQITREFGNPFDVARRIINDFEAIEGGEDVAYGGYTQEEIDNMPFFRAVKINIKNTINKVKRRLLVPKVKTDKVKQHNENEDGELPQSRVDSEREGQSFGGFDYKYDYKFDYRLDPQGDETDRKYKRYNPDTDRYDRQGSSRYVPSAPQNSAPNMRSDGGVTEKSKGRGARVTARIIFFLPFMILAIAFWSVGISLLVSGVGCVAGGAWQMVLNLFRIWGEFNLAQFGISLTAIGIGILLTTVSVKFVKGLAILSARYFGYKRKKKTEVGVE